MLSSEDRPKTSSYRILMFSRRVPSQSWRLKRRPGQAWRLKRLPSRDGSLSKTWTLRRMQVQTWKLNLTPKFANPCKGLKTLDPTKVLRKEDIRR